MTQSVWNLHNRLGANPLVGPIPESLGSYPITVDASSDPVGLGCALRSVEPGGVCTSVGIYFSQEVPIPLFQMYTTGVTFRTGRINARVDIPQILALVESGSLKPERVTTKLASWAEASDALLDRSAKVVIVRD